MDGGDERHRERTMIGDEERKKTDRHIYKQTDIDKVLSDRCLERRQTDRKATNLIS